jgi:competence protein ComEC
LISDSNKGYFRAKLLSIDDSILSFPILVEMRWYRPTQHFQEGQVVELLAKFKPVYGRGNPAGFDRQKWLYSEHIAYQASIKKFISIVDNNLSFRAILYEKVKKHLESFENKGVMLALSFADKSLISFDKKDQIRKLGISHLFAISGLHIGLFFTFTYFIANFLVLRLLPVPLLGWFSWRLINGIALSGAFLYAYLAGFSLPTQRAFLMLLFAVIIFSMKRKSSLIDLLTLTLFLLLVWDPLAVMGLSLWLSFMAVSVIVFALWYFPQVAEVDVDSISNENMKLNFIKRLLKSLLKYVKILLLIQLSITLLMMPIQLLSFAGFNLLAPLINFIAIPLFSLLVIPLILLAAIFAIFGGYFELISHFLFTLADSLIHLFFSLFEESVNYYQLLSNQQTALIIFGITLSFISLLILTFSKSDLEFTQLQFMKQLPVKLLGFFVVVVICLIVASMIIQIKKSDQQEEWFVETFDIGQGLAVLVRSNNETMLYDTGPRYPSGFTTAAVEIVPYLRAQGINRIDYLIVSHSDSDHAGGFSVIVNEFKVKNIVLGEALKKGESLPYSVMICKSGQQWTLGKLEVNVLSPFKSSKNNNNNSCVLHVLSKQHSLLLT